MATSVEIFSLNTLSWRLGPPLPEPLSHATSVSSIKKTSFLFIGGRYTTIDRPEEEARYSDKIYEFDAEVLEWNQRPEKLERPSSEMAAILMNSQDVQCFEN